MKSSRENVISAIEFRKPDRLPVIFDAFGVSDVHRIKWNEIGTGDHTQSLTFDEWNCGWSRSEVKNMGQVTIHPLDSWRNLESYRWPDPDDPAFYEGMDARFAGSEDKYVLTDIFMVLFERMHSLRGFQNLLTDLLLEQEKVGDLADRIVEIHERIIENLSRRFPGMIHGIIFTDDWGTEENLMISPELWIEFFQPRYRKIFDACKNAGWHVWLHSCGKINEIIGDLIDVGVDVLNLQQPTVLGIEEIGRKYSGKVCFLSLCDIQKTLPFKDGEAIIKEANSLLRHWGTDDGGFILGDYGNGEAINVPLWKKKIMFDAFVSADRWSEPSR